MSALSSLNDLLFLSDIGLVTTHKPHDNFLGRPVINQICDPTYKLCKELQRIIHPLAIKAKSYIRDSRHFKQMLKDVQFEEQFIQLSFDIRSLFPSIPVKPTLSIIHKKLQNDKTLKDRTTWKPKNIVNLIQICTEETHFKDFEGHLWTQIDGTAMGKSISGDVAGIFMESYENEFVLDPEKNKFVLFVAIWGRAYSGFLRISQWVPSKNKMDNRSRERRKALIC